MIRFTATLTTLALLAPASTEAQTMVISRGGSRAVRTAPPENFTGNVRVEMLFEALDPSHASGGSVTFEPGARTAWHSHPRGQILIVTAGTGRVQRWGGPIEEIRAGDVVRIPAGQKHWHGASPQASMTHIAMSEHRDGTAVEWMEKVSDEQYNAAPRARSTGDHADLSGPRQQAIAPGLATLTDDVLYGDVWRRPELSPRDRSLVTISVLIATGKTAQLAGHLGRPSTTASSQPRPPAFWRTWRSTAAGRTRSRRSTSTSRSTRAEGRHRRTARRGPALAAPASDAARARAVTDELGAVAPKFASSPTTWCSTTCGGGPISRRGIGAWSRSPPSQRWATTISSTSTCGEVSRAG